MRILSLILILFATTAVAQENDRRKVRNKGAGVPDQVVEAYEARSFHGMPYRFLLPEDYDSSISYPLILSLHGGGGLGDDNRSQMRAWTSKFVDPKWRQKYPCIVVAPQSWDTWLTFNERAPDPESGEQTWTSAAWEAWFADRGFPSDRVSIGSLTMAFILVDEIARQYSVDEDRVYILGHSGGAFGTWNALWHAPDRFAAAIPTAGGMVPWRDPARFKDVPVWTFHGDDDPVVTVEFTREIFEKAKKAGGNMKYTELPGVKHGANGPAFKYKGDDPEKGYVTHSSSDRCSEDRSW